MIKANLLGDIAKTKYLKKAAKKVHKFCAYGASQLNYKDTESFAEARKLHLYRTQVMRPKLRTVHLGRAFIKGSKYSKTEQPKTPLTREQKNEVTKFILEHEPQTISNEIDNWFYT